jgi:AbiEi antitoxin C-terminal domain
MRITRLEIAKPDIASFFENSSQRIFSRGDLDRILAEFRDQWNLPVRMTLLQFADFLVSQSKLKRVAVEFANHTDTRFTWDDVPLLEVISTLRARSYYSHYTAMKAHGLTEQVPKTIYVNQEQPGRSNPSGILKQESIDAAFARPQRLSNNIGILGDYRICAISGQNTNRAGVVTQSVADIDDSLVASVDITGLERTLIDIAVRPAYSGGVGEVLSAYRAAAGQASVNRIAALLKKIAYVYPYHQAIGFYLERSGGYNDSAIGLLREIEQKVDFYLTHQMGETEFVPKWRLVVPKGL